MLFLEVIADRPTEFCQLDSRVRGSLVLERRGVWTAVTLSSSIGTEGKSIALLRRAGMSKYASRAV
jgi:hypothetical protein